MVIPLDYLFPYSHGKTVSEMILLNSSKYNRSPKCNIDLVLVQNKYYNLSMQVTISSECSNTFNTCGTN